MAYPDFSYHWVLTRQTGSINNISFLYNITHASSVFQWNLWQNTRNKFKLYCRWKVSPMSCYWFVLKGVISLTHSHLICTRLHAISSPFTVQDRIWQILAWNCNRIRWSQTTLIICVFTTYHVQFLVSFLMLKSKLQYFYMCRSFMCNTRYNDTLEHRGGTENLKLLFQDFRFSKFLK